MVVIGMAGKACSGKDAVADYLCANYGFIKFSFGDGVRREVVEAFDLGTDDLLIDRDTKEVPTNALTLRRCSDPSFVKVARAKLVAERPDTFDELDLIWLSPRWVQQTWGSEYRRASDPDYWIKRADEWMYDTMQQYPYPEIRPQHWVNTSTRFENERQWIREDFGGNVWHLHRDGIASVHAHESESALEVLPDEREIWNNSDLEALHQGIDLLLSTNAKFVRCEPLETSQEKV